jgi:tetratricopeptide (TPR) repeat protein
MKALFEEAAQLDEKGEWPLNCLRFSGIMRGMIFFGVMFGILILSGPELGAIPFGGGDDVETYSREDLETNQELQELLVKDMKNDLRRGLVGNIGRRARQLLEVSPMNAEVRALYSIYLVSMGDLERASLELKKAAKEKDTKYAFYAKAMIKHEAKEYNDAITLCTEAIGMDPGHPFPRNVLGGVYFDLGQNDKAIENFSKAVELSPAFSLGYTNLGFVYLREGDLQRSREFFDEAVRLAPGNASNHYGLALVHERRGNLIDAIKELKKSLALRPLSNPALSKLGELELKCGRFEEALMTGQAMEAQGIQGASELMAAAYMHLGDTSAALVKLRSLPSSTVNSDYLKGLVQLLEGEYETALKLMEAVLNRDSQHFGAFAARAAVKFFLGEKLDSRNLFVRRWGESEGAVLHFLAGCYYAERGDWVKATNEWRSSRGLFKGFSTTGMSQDDIKTALRREELKHVALGIVYFINQLHQSALEQYKKALAFNAESIWANYFSAQFYLMKKDDERAVEYLKNSLKKAPKFFAALHTIGDVELSRDKLQSAAKYYEKALTVTKNAALLLRLGSCYEKMGFPGKAQVKYEKLVKNYPDSFVGYNQLAWLYAKQGVRLDEAISLAEKANRLQFGNPSVLDTMGWIHFQRRNYDDALASIEKSNEIRPNNPTVLYHLGAVYHAMGKKIAAKEHLQKALGLSEDFEEAQEARKLLSQ